MGKEKRILYTERSKRIAFALSVFLAVSMLPVFSAYADGGKEIRLKEEKKAKYYEINGELRNAASDQPSMGNGGIRKPMELIEENGEWTLRLELKSITPKTGGKKSLKGYLGRLEYFPGYQGSAKPPEGAMSKEVPIESYHDVYDIYNDAKRGIDETMKGRLYPQYCKMPIASPQLIEDAGSGGVPKFKGNDITWIRVYVPLMEILNPGGGNPYARLMLDWSSLREKQNLSNNPKEVGRLAKKPPKNKDKPRNKPNRKHRPGKRRAGKKLNIRSLNDGVYAIKGKMVKTDGKTPSMADNAINHIIKLKVEGGRYFLCLRMRGLNINGQNGYLKNMRYFSNTYRLNSAGIPKGQLNNVKILAYHKKKGERVSDSYGTDYPSLVKFPVIKRALRSGYLPLQVFVPIMEAIAPGTGTQELYLKLDLKSVKTAAENSNEFTKEGESAGKGVTAAGGGKGSLLGMFKKSKSKLNKKDEDSDGNSVLSGDSNSQSGESDEGEDRKKEPPLKKHVFPGVATLIAGTIPTYKKRKRIFKLFRI